jgi:hypothetical protein
MAGIVPGLDDDRREPVGRDRLDTMGGNISCH